MAASGRAILQAHVDGLLPESVPVDVQWTLASGVLGVTSPVTLNSGDNTLSVPTGTDLIVLIPPVTNVGTLVWSKTGGTTNGIQQPSNAPNIVAWSAGAVIVNASVSTSPCTLIFLG